MNLQLALNIYNETNKKLKAFEYVEYLNSWDIQTEAPTDSIEEKNNVMEVLNDYVYDLSTNIEYNNAIEYLYRNKNELDEILKHEIEVVFVENQKIKKIPKEEYIKYSSLLNTAYCNFVKAKNQSDFNLVKNDLQKIIEYKKNYIDWQKGNFIGYDVLLNEYEKDFTTQKYDKFFNLIKEKIVPLIEKIKDKKLDYNREIFNQKFSVSKQKEFSKYLQSVICLDSNKFVIKESEHPFTTNFTNKDVRITNHYHEDDLKSAIFSDIHEMGHALYELQVDDRLNHTLSGGGASMAMHESQSRLMENLVGRSYEFWEVHFPKLKQLFSKELKNCTLQDFYYYINEVKLDFIRTEADELTYPIHILIRYEIEKGIFENKYTIDELPKVWNNLYKKYLFIDVEKDSQGILQDVHWYGGDFGYFPTYALGTSYGVQIFNKLKKDINLNNALKNNTIKDLTVWLKNNLHKYGSTLYPNELLKRATNEDFNPNYYVDYLYKKFKKLYKID